MTQVHSVIARKTRARDWGALQEVIEECSNVNARDDDRQTLLLALIRSLDPTYDDGEPVEPSPPPFLSCVRELLRRGADANAGDRQLLQFPLHEAAIRARCDLVELLLKYQASPHQQLVVDHASVSSPISDGTPLHIAANDGFCSSIEVLLNHGADANARGFAGETPLHLAAMNGHVRAVGLLIRRGADLNARSTGYLREDILPGETPLHLAVAFLRPEVVKTLRFHKASEAIRNDDGHTPRDIIVHRLYRVTRVLGREFPIERIQLTESAMSDG